MKALKQAELLLVSGGTTLDWSNIIICYQQVRYTVAKKPITYLS